jgi:uncharacterized protein YcsI (UPF0317 family)
MITITIIQKPIIMKTKKYPVNTVLHTKDGRQIGNAIVINHITDFNIIKTDYGHTCKFTDDEIESFFYTDKDPNYMLMQMHPNKHLVNKPKGFVLIMEYPKCNKKVGAFEPYTSGEFLNYPKFWKPIY